MVPVQSSEVGHLCLDLSELILELDDIGWFAGCRLALALGVGRRRVGRGGDGELVLELRLPLEEHVEFADCSRPREVSSGSFVDNGTEEGAAGSRTD